MSTSNITLFDSVQKVKLSFEPIEKNKLSLYVCGPTVYDDAHLGHAKSALVFDLLKRVFVANNYEVTYARNITDIDDKIINRAAEKNITISELSDIYTKAYHDDMSALGIQTPDIEPRATESMESIMIMVQKLVTDGFAYQISNGDIYFDTQKDDKYLSISNQTQNEDERQERVASNPEKKHPADFALWKATSENEENCFNLDVNNSNTSGRPGWHLECSAMIEKHFKSDDNAEFQIDIHGGGADLLFPHHENEAAQSRCASKKELAKYWIHNGFVNIDGQKMSKSLGNSFFIKDALKVYNGEVLRYYLLSVHYRSNFNFNEEDLIVSKKRLDKLYRLRKRLFGMKITDEKTEFQTKLLEALNDDMNVSVAYALIDEMISNANEILDATPKDKLIKRQSLADMAFIETVLGFGLNNPFEYFQFGMDEATKSKIGELIVKRGEAKKEKNFELSDSIRDEILAFGVGIMDTVQGTFWEKVEN
jgi:cysteinyl-tRNA synthetase